MEKVKVYLPDSLIRLIDSDCEAFDIHKPDGKINRNRFLNELLQHYFYSYRDKRQAQLAALQAVLHDAAPLPASVELDAAVRCLAVVSQSCADCDDPAKGISLKPTRRTEPIIQYVTSDSLGGASISSYLRDMLNSYASLPQSEREKIMFSNEYETIQGAIRKNRMISFATRRTPNIVHHVNVYAVATSKERLFNYVLCEEEGRISSYRLSRINLPVTMPEARTFSPSDEEKFLRMLTYGPAFAINTLEDIRVRFTDAGLRKYQAIYLNRPDPAEVGDHEMVFQCARDQIVRYLERLGADAVIVSPQDVRDEAAAYYKAAAEAYAEGAETAEATGD